jgi:hypothetical protein
MTILLWPMLYCLAAALLSILLIWFDQFVPRRREHFNHSTGASARFMALAANALLMLGLALWILSTIAG